MFQELSLEQSSHQEYWGALVYNPQETVCGNIQALLLEAL